MLLQHATTAAALSPHNNNDKNNITTAPFNQSFTPSAAISCQLMSSSLVSMQLLAAACPPPPNAVDTVDVSKPSMLRRLTLMWVALLGISGCVCVRERGRVV